MKKFIPLIVLALFILGAYFMIKGMNNAVKITQPKHKFKNR